LIESSLILICSSTASYTVHSY